MIPEMNRRAFIKTLLCAGVAAGATLPIGLRSKPSDVWNKMIAGMDFAIEQDHTIVWAIRWESSTAIELGPGQYEIINGTLYYDKEVFEKDG